MTRFLGNIEAKTDAKGRVFIPATFRKQLQAAGEESLVLRKDVFQDCLVLYPESVWCKTQEQLRRRLNRWNARQQAVFRQFVSDAEVVVPDGNGRILIPRRYLQMAGIDSDVRFIGMDDTIEIWARERAEAPFMDAGEFSRALQEALGGEDGYREEERKDDTRGDYLSHTGAAGTCRGRAQHPPGRHLRGRHPGRRRTHA